MRLRAVAFRRAHATLYCGCGHTLAYSGGRTVVLANESGVFEVNGVVLRVKPDGTMSFKATL